MLRQVAYETLSRRDRKTRHLIVAAHLRATFGGDGEEVADVIARHYLDALAAVPDDVDVAEIRERAIAELVRAAERAERTGAPARAAVSFATAAELLDESGVPGSRLAAAQLWERATATGVISGDWDRCSSLPSEPRPTTATRRRGVLPACRRRPGRRCAGRAGTARRASS